MIRFASITHSVSFGQRYVDLGQHAGNKGPITVSTPGDRSAAPPGYYMLFVVTDEGVPSVAATVQLR